MSHISGVTARSSTRPDRSDGGDWVNESIAGALLTQSGPAKPNYVKFSNQS